MNKYGVPASIKLAQALLESNAGNSVLSKKSNNHFGIKGSESHCRNNTCVTHSDDSPNDRFKQYATVWESYRDHSKLLNSARYKSLHNYSQKDYKKWAAGLSNAGYASDISYPKKLITLIEKYELYVYDK